MGGAAERKKKRGGAKSNQTQKQPSFFENLFKEKQNTRYQDPEAAWNSLTKAEQDARIDMLWDKARRLNSKLRFQARLPKMAE